MFWHANSLFSMATASIPWHLHLLVAVGVVVISFFLGNYLGKSLRMPDHGWKISVILFSLLASVSVLVMGPPMKFGVDLKGGVLLVYEVDKTKQKPGETADMGKLIESISRRINPGGQKEVTIRQYGADQIEIIVPEVDETEVQRIERTISRAGSLEFRILATERDHKDLMERALADPSKDRLVDSSNRLLAWWVPVTAGKESSIAGYEKIALRTKKRGGREILEVLVVPDDCNVTGDYLSQATSGNDRMGKPCVNFAFDSEGAKRFGALTSTHLPDKLTGFTYKLGIILDGELYSAPGIQSTISDRGEITGSFTTQEVREQVDVLNAGALPAALVKEPVSKLYSGATLGTDTIEKSTRAMLISSVLVLAFMLWYYRFSGIVANIALGLNLLILFAVMIAFKAAFTLTGFAGLALTVGMAVDNNVLVYERLREELDRGATIRMAIRNAFHRAGATIIDCNLTHLIAATVLYMIGTDQLRGFALTLWIGVVTSMYTAVFVSHVVFDIAEKRQWLTKVKMLRLIGHTNIDFMRLAPYCLGMSLLLSVMAVGVSIYRGQGLFDIDFTGGISVQVRFNEPQNTAEVRRLLNDRPESKKLGALAISDVQLKGERPGLQFNINTSEQDMSKVKRELFAVFGDKLVRNAVTFSEPKAIEGAAKPAADAKPSPEPKKDDQARTLPFNRSAKASGLETLAMAQTETLPDSTAKGTAAADAKPAENSAAAPAAEKPGEVPAFAGGSQTTLRFKDKVDQKTAEQMLLSAMEAIGLNTKSVTYLLSVPESAEGTGATQAEWKLEILLPPDQTKNLLATLENQVANEPSFPASNKIGAGVASHTQVLAIYAIVASWAGIILYLWVRFQGVAFGLAAVTALVHDVLMMLGAIALSIYIAPYLGFALVEPFKISLPIVAAFLAIIGYSVNDTIVVFDRIREVRGKDPRLTRQMVNDSTNQTLSRTLLTSVTVALVVIVLYFFGGEALHGFAFALVIGVITGTYSSIYIAAPILLWLVGKHQDHIA